MEWINKLFQKRDVAVIIAGFVIMQMLACLLIDRFMFSPVKNGYDKTIDGFLDIGTNGISIAARLTGPCKGEKAVVYCHGNAEDITAIDGRFDALTKNGYTIATFDYPGYGLSDGEPSEEGCNRNALRLYDYLVDDMGFQPKDIVVMGYSIGTGVAVELATKRTIGGLWLEAPYLSAPRVVTRVRMLFIDPFPNINKIEDIKCPIVMLHGTADSIVPYAQGIKLYEAAPYPKWFLPIQGADHVNFIDVMGVEKYNASFLGFLKDGRLTEETHNER